MCQSGSSQGSRTTLNDEKKEFVVAIWAYAVVGSGKKSMEGLLSLHLVVGLKHVPVSWADDGEEKCDVKPERKTNWNPYLSLTISKDEETVICRKCWCCLLLCCTRTWLGIQRNWKRRCGGAGGAAKLAVNPQQGKQQIKDHMPSGSWWSTLTLLLHVHLPNLIQIFLVTNTNPKSYEKGIWEN